MSDFLAKSHCRGRRPARFSSMRHFARPHLVAKLLRERHVARFLVAPEGFGKTGVAFEYAETVFNFDHVFWINAASPCFLRDLDKGNLAQTLAAKESVPYLVVVEDVPALDPKRVDLFSSFMDKVLETDCEVLVTCTPVCDAFGCHCDRVRLGSVDLLLLDSELVVSGSLEGSPSRYPSALTSAERIAALVWGSDSSRSSFLSAIAREDLPADLQRCMVTMLTLGQGFLGEALAFSSCDKGSVELLCEQYSYLGIDRQTETFRTIFLSPEELSSLFLTRLSSLTQGSFFLSGDVFVTRLADVLIAKGSFERACDIVRLLAGRQARAAWLCENSFGLIRKACLMPACDLYESLKGEKAGQAYFLDLGEACRRTLLEDRLTAWQTAYRVIKNIEIPRSHRAIATLVLLLSSEADTLDQVMQFVEVVKRDASSGDVDNQDFFQGDISSLVFAVEVLALLKTSLPKAMDKWLEGCSKGVRDDALLNSAAWIFEHIAESLSSCTGGSLKSVEEIPSQIEQMKTVLYCKINDLDAESQTLFTARSGGALECLVRLGSGNSPVFDPQILYTIRSIEMSLFSQRALCAQSNQEKSEARRTFLATHPDVFRKDEMLSTSRTLRETDPLLTVNLYGGLEVKIGDTRVDPSLFKRQKVKTLLALLVLNRGREFSRDKLVGLLWPDSDIDSARRNFYGIWSLLRRALKTPSGRYPYLIRQQQGLRIDANLLVSDVFQFDEVCQILLFEDTGYGGWGQLTSQINKVFMGELLPSENENGAVEGYRMESKTKLVDALISASTRLVHAGEMQEGLWLARAAFQRDQEREDTYTTLMRAQLGAGQRTAALDTFFLCQSFLVEGLGIDPSFETYRLYQSILESDSPGR